ncbi:conserved hypothetical protein [Candidatus Nitrotoga sp. HW29]|uniref:gamma-butyrobetaine hydroxylase-like domain-containing protein n=1 Tax=Candidatus Nitrotoga sp. HW29 TaxID=2886963 RepID=UPI001EF1B8EF|nr:DUF971 domain-containing protein [Candidatus Nitrotoga sp. HW29]CAH1905754.1 conserved hypothetical protein [Candidatus Nitrotoga sp. HW29]
MLNPTEITLHQQSKLLEIAFDDGSRYRLPYEFLRVHSPSAAVRGHGPSQAVLQVGKQDVNVIDVQPVGSYAIKLTFDDSHNTGLYSWDYLNELGKYQDALWHEYLSKLAEAGESRVPNHPVAGFDKSGEKK